MASRDSSIIAGLIITEISGGNVVWASWAEHAHLRGGRQTTGGAVRPIKIIPATAPPTGQEEHDTRVNRQACLGSGRRGSRTKRNSFRVVLLLHRQQLHREHNRADLKLNTVKKKKKKELLR